MNERKYRRTVISGLVIMGAPLALSLVAYARGVQKNEGPAAPTGSSGCILAAPTMRYEHMTYLKARRDSVVRDGHRKGPNAPGLLSTCSGCHHDRAQFCDKCHTRAAVNLDCFGCHTY
jgi:hypothetical protein